jgi:hypothetical protein
MEVVFGQKLRLAEPQRFGMGVTPQEFFPKRVGPVLRLANGLSGGDSLQFPAIV